MKRQKMRGGKRTDKRALELFGHAPVSDEIAQGRGTAPLLGRALLPGGGVSTPMFGEGGAPTKVIFHGGIIQRNLSLGSRAEVTLDSGVLVDEKVRISIEPGGTLHAQDASLGNRFVRDTEVSTRHANGVTVAHISTEERTIASALGKLPDCGSNHIYVGNAIAKALGSIHDVIPELSGGRGARLRDGTYDEQVDVFLQAKSGDPSGDVRLQVVLPAELAKQIGEYGTAIEVAVDRGVLQAAIAHKDGFASKETIDLAISCPIPIGGPTRRKLRDPAIPFASHGYRRVWFVDGSGTVVDLPIVASGS